MKDQFTDSNFADKEISAILRELNFNEECIGFYNPSHQLNNHVLFPLEGGNFDNWNKEPNLISAPTYQQIEQWLWEKHRIYLRLHESGNMFVYSIEDFEKVLIAFKPNDFVETPTTAKIEGIKKAIKHLHSKK